MDPAYGEGEPFDPSKSQSCKRKMFLAHRRPLHQIRARTRNKQDKNIKQTNDESPQLTGDEKSVLDAED